MDSLTFARTYSPMPKTYTKKVGRKNGDPADFSKLHLMRIYSPYQESFLRPGAVFDEFHHALGRGKEFGAGLRHPLRSMFSSVLNAIPIDRQSHNDPNINDYDVRCLLVDKAITAVVESGYHLEEKDELFLIFFRRWRMNHRQPKLLQSLL